MHYRSEETDPFVTPYPAPQHYENIAPNAPTRWPCWRKAWLVRYGMAWYGVVWQGSRSLYGGRECQKKGFGQGFGHHFMFYIQTIMNPFSTWSLRKNGANSKVLSGGLLGGAKQVRTIPHLHRCLKCGVSNDCGSFLCAQVTWPLPKNGAKFKSPWYLSPFYIYHKIFQCNAYMQ